MSARHPVRIRAVGPLVAVVTLTGALLVAVSAPSPAAADACPDVQVVFARGSGEPAGLGGAGQPFVDAIRSRVPDRSVEAYPLDYPASLDYRNSALAGADAATAHIETEVANCPDTKLVLGGYSQGASVMEWATNALPPQAAEHVAAVALFGTPSTTYAISLLGDPLPTIASAYRPKSIDLCVPDDIICAEGGNMAAHLMYAQSGMLDEAATFVADRLSAS